MARIIQCAHTFPSGDLSMFSSTGGSATLASASPPGNTKYYLTCPAGGSGQISLVTTIQNFVCQAFQVRFADATPTTANVFLGGSGPFQLRLNTDGSVDLLGDISSSRAVVASSSTGIFTDATWAYVVLYIELNDAGTLQYKCAVDGTTIFSGTYTSGNFDGSISVFHMSSSASSTTTDFAEIFWMDDTASMLSSVNYAGYNVYEFMISGTGYSTAGSALNSGAWGDTGEQPAGTTNNAQYTASAAFGYGYCDGTVKPGPNGVLSSSDVIVGVEYFGFLKRGGGGSTTHTFDVGNNVDGNQSNAVSLSTTDTWYYFSSASNTVYPEYNEIATMGGGVSGNQDLIMEEMYCCLAVEVGSSTQNLTPSLYTKTHTFYTPTVTPGSVGLTPSLFANSNTIYAHTVNATYDLLPIRVDQTNTFYTPTIAPGAVDLAPSLFAETNAFYAATVSPGAVNLDPALFANSNTFYVPVVYSFQSLQPSLFAQTNTFYSATVSPGAVDLAPSLFAESNTFYSATVGGTYDLTPALFANGNTFYQPTVGATYDLAPSLFQQSNTFYSATITTTVDLAPSLFTQTNTFYSATVSLSGSPQSLLPSLFANTNTFYSASVSTAYGLSPNLFQNQGAFYTPVVAASYEIAPNRFDQTETFYSPSVAATYDLLPALFSETNTFYVHSVTANQTLTQAATFANSNDFFTHAIAFLSTEESFSGGYAEVSTLRERKRLKEKKREKKIARTIIVEEDGNRTTKRLELEIKPNPDLSKARQLLAEWKRSIDRQSESIEQKHRLENDRLQVAQKLRQLSEAKRKEMEAQQMAYEQQMFDVMIKQVQEAEEEFEVNLILKMLIELNF